MPIHEAMELFKTALTDVSQPFEMATDGGLNASKGTFGLILAHGLREIWECAGPVDGDPNTSNSKRPELVGYAAGMELLLLLFYFSSVDYVDSSPTVTVQVWMDSSSAGRHIQRLLRQENGKRKYPSDFDIISHIQWLWGKIPAVIHKLSWVKAHQDSQRPYEELARNAQLNIQADRLATQYYENMSRNQRVSQANPLFFPASKVSLIVNGQRVTAQAKETLRFHITGTKMREFLQTKHPSWKDTTWNAIDFEGFGMALKQLDLIQQFRVIKYATGWWNTGTKRKQMEPNAKSECPSCGRTTENQAHVLRCREGRSRSVRYKAVQKLRATIVTTKGGSTTWHVLFTGITHWLEGGKDVTSESPGWVQEYNLVHPSVSARLKQTLNRAMSEQNQIGWEAAARGYLSSTWVKAQQIEHPRSTEKGIRQQWLTSIIKEVWKFSFTMWEHRNSVLHSNNPKVEILRESSMDAAIRRKYELQDSFAVSDQVLFDMPLQVRLKTSARSKQHWLVLVARYHNTTSARKSGKQPLLTKFFTRRTMRENNNNEVPELYNTTQQLNQQSMEYPQNIRMKQQKRSSSSIGT
jgi:hypothetical protein